METTTRDEAGTWALALERAGHWRGLAVIELRFVRRYRSVLTAGELADRLRNAAHYKALARASVRASASWPSPLAWVGRWGSMDGRNGDVMA